jgi:hypothetical protein
MVAKNHVYSKLPRNYKFIDPARSKDQAIALRNAQPKEYHPIIVKTGKNRGKDKVVFPYHIAGKHSDLR